MSISGEDWMQGVGREGIPKGFLDLYQLEELKFSEPQFPQP